MPDGSESGLPDNIVNFLRKVSADLPEGNSTEAAPESSVDAMKAGWAIKCREMEKLLVQQGNLSTNGYVFSHDPAFIYIYQVLDGQVVAMLPVPFRLVWSITESMRECSLNGLLHIQQAQLDDLTKGKEPA